MRVNVLDHGYLELVEGWGSDQSIIETARMSTAKGFLGWGTKQAPGDEKLLAFLWDHKHSTPFEFGGLTVEAKAPLMVFREWHRHRTQSYSEVSARYAPLPDENYVPSLERVLAVNAPTANRQARGSGTRVLVEGDAVVWREDVTRAYAAIEALYAKGLELGVAKELARLPVPVGRYSRMRATANLRNWLHFLSLRCAPGAQWEIRQYADAVAKLVAMRFPRTYDVAREALGLPPREGAS